MLAVTLAAAGGFISGVFLAGSFICYYLTKDAEAYGLLLFLGIMFLLLGVTLGWGLM